MSELMIRRLYLADYGAYSEHLLSLDKDSRHARFEGALSDEAIKKYAAWIMVRSDWLFGAYEGSRLVGVGELRPSDDRLRAEVAFSVNSDHRRQGIAYALFKRTIECATDNGIEALDMVTLPDNYGVRALARKFGVIMDFQRGALKGRLDIKKGEASQWLTNSPKESSNG